MCSINNPITMTIAELIANEIAFYNENDVFDTTTHGRQALWTLARNAGVFEEVQELVKKS